MSIFKYLTLSHLQKVLAALETRFKGIEHKIDSAPQSDWNENDSSNKSYIQNRTHYEDISDFTEIWNEAFDMHGELSYQVDVSSSAEWINQLYDGAEYHIVFNGDVYNGKIVYDSTGLINGYVLGNFSVFGFPLPGGDPNCPFIIVIDIDNRMIIFNTILDSNVNSISLSLKLRTVHKLDNKYLNGGLIKSGFNKGSEIFNGDPYDERIYELYISGESDSNHYDFWGYNNSILDVFTYVYSISYATTLNNNVKRQVLNFEILSVDDSNGRVYGIISFNKTFDEYNEVINEQVFLHIPSKFAFDEDSHAEGRDSISVATASHSEGTGTLALGVSSHSEGDSSKAMGHYSHSEGYATKAQGMSSHSEGSSTIAQGYASHSGGFSTQAIGDFSHSEGYYTTAQRRSQHVFGEYNILDNTGTNSSSRGTYIEIVGKGTDTINRSNARTLDWSGNEVLAGKLTVGVAPTNDMDVATKKYVDDNIGSGGSSTLIDLTDTTISSPTNGQILMYNSTTLKWENTSLPIYAGDVADYWQGGSF